MKKIGITQRLVEIKEYNEIRTCLDISWFNLLNCAGYLPCPIPYTDDIRPFIQSIGLSGVILSGGNDLSSVSGSDLSAMRDKHEHSIIDVCNKTEIPVLGVCRGMQFINGYFGGSVRKTENHAGTHHDLKHSTGRFSFLTEKFNNVNSFHNYEIDIPGFGLKILSRSDDGCIESFEHEYLKILGIMWHPERGTQENDIELIRRFFE